jgi:hypothetical protein
MKRFGLLASCALMGFVTGSLLGGCGDEAEKAPAPTTAPLAVSNPGGAPSYGTQSGMGFSTGDAAHNDGSGSGLMGFHGTGAMGTSNAITDNHPAQAPTFPTTEPVLPPL